MTTHSKLIGTVILLLMLTSNMVNASPKSNVKGEEVTFTGADGTLQKSYVAYDEAIKGKRPALLVVPEWWGCGDYVRKRANMLAELGYIAILVDMYGDGKMAEDVKAAQTLAGPFYKDPQLSKSRLEAAIKKVKEYAQTDTKKIAAIGYCFGGNVVLNAARLGMDLKAVVSFHGNLDGVEPKKDVTKAAILVCHGGADEFIGNDEIRRFKGLLDQAGTKYTFITYPGATHAFTNPAATETGKKFSLPIAYNEEGDKKSWEDMKAFLTTAFK